METIEIEGYYLPPAFRDQVSTFRTEVYRQQKVTVHLKIPVLTPATVGALASHLKKERERSLARLPIEHIVGVLDEASRRWLEDHFPYRKAVLKTIPALTGFSSEVVEASIDAEMESSLREDIWRALRSEINDPFVLDDFQYAPHLDGFTRAFGPELITAIFSENIPALPHLLFMRAALVKSACLGKVSTGEPTFAPLYVKTIEEIDPQLAECMAVLSWQRDDEEIEKAVFDQSDAVILFGGVEACQAIRKRIPGGVKVLVHGHRLGFGVLGRRKLTHQDLEPLAWDVAFDCSMFDQQACLAPHVYYLEEGGEVSPKEFTRALALAMEAINLKMPRGRISPGEASMIHQVRAKYEFKELEDGEILLLHSPRGTDWTVIFEKNPGVFHPSPLNRVIRVFSVDDIFQILPVLRPMGPFLQNAAVAIGDGREMEFIARLGELGVTRVTAPGKMPLPSMMWHHDGISPIHALLRWCDVEKKEIAGKGRDRQGRKKENKGESES